MAVVSNVAEDQSLERCPDRCDKICNSPNAKNVSFVHYPSLSSMSCDFFEMQVK